MAGERSELRWRGVVIAEGLRDPALINGMHVVGAQISRDGMPIDDDGATGRWHLYWVDAGPDELDLIQAETVHAWYSHFWTGNRLLVIYDDARFELTRDDPASWAAAVSHGLGQGLLPEWLDFPTDDSTGTLDEGGASG